MDEQVSTPDEILAEVGRVRRLTRGALADGSWRYLAVWSVVFLGSWITSFFPVGKYYWIVAVPAGYLGDVADVSRASSRPPGTGMLRTG